MVFGSSVVFLNRLFKKEALNEEKHEQPDDFLECFFQERETVL